MKARTMRLGAALCCLLFPTLAHATFATSYDYYVYANPSDGVPVSAEAVLTGEVYAAGDYTKTGDYGSFGYAIFAIDMRSRIISAEARAHGVKVATYTFGTGTGRVEKAAFDDRLTFTAGAGTYPDGLYATLTGRIRGTLRSDVGAGATVRIMAELGTQRHDTGLLTTGVDTASVIVVDEPFDLVLELVAPGETLTQPTGFAHTLRLGLYDGRTWSVEYNTGSGYVTGDADISFPNGVRITSLRASPGVTWTSESGAFEGGVLGVPEADAPLLLRCQPNPFNPQTVFSFTAAASGRHRLDVHDLAGRLVSTLLDEQLPAGATREVVWDGRDDTGAAAAAGVYIVTVEAGAMRAQRKTTLVR